MSLIDDPSRPSTVDRDETRATVPVDVIIVAFNEEVNLPHTLHSVAGWAHRVFVIDSGSTDATCHLARQCGAQVIHHAWEGYARQKNWALDNLPLETPWILILDADESVPDDLRNEIAAVCRQDPADVPDSGFYLNRALIFMGQRIRHCGYNPSWNLRLFKRGAARYEDRPVHEHMVLQGTGGYLHGLLHHEDRRGLEYYIAKHNRYSTLEAETLFFGESPGHPSIQPALFGNAIQRRRWFRTHLYPCLPAKWLWRFLWMYFVHFGILDGANGLRFCLFISTHELFTSLKLRELKRRARHAPTTLAPTTVPTTSQQFVESPQIIALPAPCLTTPASAPLTPLPTTPTTSFADIAARRESSPYTVIEKLKRVLWMSASVLLFRCSFHNWYAWRRLVLRCFGAIIGPDVRIRPTAHIEIPWNLTVGQGSVIGDYAILYCLGKITIGRHTVISQYAHLCAGTHDYTTRRFPLIKAPITIGDEVWIAADSFVAPNVIIGDRAVVGARSTVLKNVPPDQIWAGSPAKFIKQRELKD